jgi:hypothetical protein
MLVVKPTKAMGGIHLRPTRKVGGGIPRLMRGKEAGLGTPVEVYEKPVSHPFRTLGAGNMKNMEMLKIKTSRPKKYISLNI